MKETIGFGGSCHWCTEAVFQSLRGVSDVKQGWISSAPPNEAFSEAVLVEFEPDQIGLDTLIEVHLHTHSCTSNHSMREKYRSAIYSFDDNQKGKARASISAAQFDFDQPIITQVLPFAEFKLNEERFLDYYRKNPGKPFCKANISPKLKKIRERFSEMLDRDEV